MAWSKLLKGVAFLAAMFVAGTAQAAWELNMPKGVTDITREVYGLHMLIFWICVVIGIVVFGAMIYSLIAHRKSRGVEAAQFHESTSVEIAWTIVPFLILVGMAIPAAGTLLKIEDTGDADITIKVTGYQWMWEYEYIDKGVSFYSRLDTESNAARQLDSGVDPNSVDNYLRAVDKRMVVPVDKKVRILLTSNDVIHAWWVPELGGKKDAIPGYINEMWFRADETGVYRGQCAELCGRGHGFMPVVVEVVSQDEYQSWLAERGGAPSGEETQVAEADQAGGETASDAGDAQVAQAEPGGESGGESAGGGSAGEVSKDELMTIGEEIYKGQCAACHQADGTGMPPTFPSLADSDIVAGPAEDHIDRVLNGKNAMPAYKESMSNKEIAGIVTYERNSFGNDTGDVVQPSQVEAQR